MSHILKAAAVAGIIVLGALAAVIPCAAAHEGVVKPPAAAPKAGSGGAGQSLPDDAPDTSYKTAPAAPETRPAPPHLPVNATPPNCRGAECRHTLYVPVGQKVLALEAPQDMCFLDQTAADTDQLYQAFTDMIRARQGQFFLAAFMYCDEMANAANLPDDYMPAFGLVSWMNPAIGEATSLSRQDYLDMREASFLQYAANIPGGLTPDAQVRRTESGVFIGLTGVSGTPSFKTKSTAALGTTTLQQVPVEVSLHYSGQEPPPLESVYPLMDKFIAQQVALNK